MDNRKIGIFDSGIGGVTVLKELIKILPNEEYIYYSDSKHNPYGNIDDDKLFEITCNIMDYFVENNCKAVVIACNTAGAKCSKKLREKYNNIIIVAIEPAYKMVYDYAYDKDTLVMATPGTINSEKFKNLYNKYNNGKTFLLPCDNLAHMIEDEDKTLNDYLYSLLKHYINKVSVVVLGCTHYPLIKENIKNILGDITFFDGAMGCSRRLRYLLDESNLINKRGVGKITFIDSNNSKEKENRFYEIINKYL